MKGHLRLRGKQYYVVLFLGRDASGKPRYKWHPVGESKTEAQKEMRRLLRELDTGDYIEPSKLTVGEYLEKWLTDCAKLNVAPKTFERYASIVRKSIIPAIGHHRLGKLTPLHIQAHYKDAMENGRRDGRGEKLSPRTVLQHHRILRKALKQAVRWNLIGRNPADCTDPPRFTAKEVQVLDAKQVLTLLQAAEPTRFYMPVILAVTTGMRRGELFALRWKDVDLEAGTLAVRQSLEQTKEGLAFKEPKTAKSRRVIVLAETTILALRKHKAKQAEQKLKLGPHYEDFGLVCARPDGRPINANNFSSDFQDLLKNVDVPRIRFHDLRHTHATLLLSEGIHPKIVSERLGHSTISMTLDVYSHVMPSMQEEAARKLDSALRAAPLLNREESVA